MKTGFMAICFSRHDNRAYCDSFMNNELRLDLVFTLQPEILDEIKFMTPIEKNYLIRTRAKGRCDHRKKQETWRRKTNVSQSRF